MLKFVLPKFIFKVEKWKWNKEYRLYVSTQGHFMDEFKRPIAVKLNQNGYVVIKTTYGYQTAHRLVMKTWMPTADMDNLTVDHLDHNKRNNALDNLEWVTEKENKRRAVADHLPSAAKKAKREKTAELLATKDTKELTKSERKRLRQLCPKRYHNPNLTFNDLLFYVNGIECPNLDTAIATAHTIFENSVQPGGPGPQIQHWKDSVVQQKFQALLNNCCAFNSKTIDGKESFTVYLYLNLSVKVKEDV